MTKVLIVLVNYKRAVDTVACLQSLAKLDFDKPDVVLCDNDSRDGSAEALQDFLNLTYGPAQILDAPVGARQSFVYQGPGSGMASGIGKLFLVLSAHNGGFAAGNNLAYHAVTDTQAYDYVWFLNNDTEVEPNALKALVGRMQSRPDVGICGSTLIYAYDRVSVQVMGGCGYSPLTGTIKDIGNRLQWPVQASEPEIEEQLHYISGASMLVSASFIREVGLMAEDYFLYFEEIDWAQRAKRLGFKLAYASESVVFHKEGAAIGTGKSANRSLLAEYYGLRNKLRITRRYFPWALPSIYVLSWLQVLRRVLNRQWAHANLMARVLLGLRAPQLISSRPV